MRVTTGVVPIFFLIMLVISILGCLDEYSQETKDAINAEDPDLCEKVMDSEERTTCYNRVADYIDDPVKCEAVKSEEAKSACFHRVSQQNKDPKLCDKLSELSKRLDCINGVATITNDPSICERISDPDSRDSCYYKYAEKKFDPTTCGKIVGESSRDLCYSKGGEFNRDTKACDKVADELKRDDCNKKVAAETNDKSLCDKITGEWQKTYCLAVTGKDEKACDKVSFEDKKECLINLGSNTGNPELCVQLETALKNGLVMDEVSRCYTGVAMNSGKTIYCQKANHPDGCIIEVASKLKNPDKCAAVNETQFKDICYGRLAMETNNIGLTDKISSDDERAEWIEKTKRAHPGLVDKVKFAVTDKISQTVQRPIEKAVGKSLETG